MRGSAERGLEDLGYRSAATVRTAVVLVCGVLAPFAVPAGEFAVTALVALVAIGASAVYSGRLLRRRDRHLVALDAAVVGAICLTQPWTVPPQSPAGGTSWMLAVASVTVVSYQWHTGLARGAVATVV